MHARLASQRPSLGSAWCRSGTAEHIPARIEHLLAHPEDNTELLDLGNLLCTDLVTWSAGFPAAPYLVEIAARARPALRVTHLGIIASLVTGVCHESQDPRLTMPPVLTGSMEQAAARALPLLGETLAANSTPEDTSTLLFAAAALRGNIRLAEVLLNLDACPHCSQILERHP